MKKGIIIGISLMLMSLVALSGCTDSPFTPVPPDDSTNGDQWTFLDDDILDIDGSMKVGDTGYEIMLIDILTHGVKIDLRDVEGRILGKELLTTTSPNCEFGIGTETYKVEFIDATDDSAVFKIYKKN